MIPLQIDRSLDMPLSVQLAGALRDAIDHETLRPGEPVPPTRELGRRIGVARGVVVAAYEQLIAEGYLVARQGRGTIVNPDLGGVRFDRERDDRERDDRERQGRVREGRVREGRGRADPARESSGSSDSSDSSELAAGRIESTSGGAARGPRTPPADAARAPLAPGAPPSDATDRPAWRAAWRSASTGAKRRAPALGDPALRHEIAEHLRLMRGTARGIADVIVTAGARDGLGLLLTSLGAGRSDQLVVGVEDPGYPSLRAAAARHGARIVPLPVDDDGLRTDLLPMGVLDAVIVTPSHQYPVGGSLPLPRRLEMLEWASRSGAVIVEDDYDSELRYAGSPLPALAALDDPVAGSVVTLGTFSSTISPALAAGFMVAPARLRSIIEPTRFDLGSPTSEVVQLALADYLASGELRRGIARLRRRLATRRDLLSERLAGVMDARSRPMSGGLHAVIEFGEGEAARSRESVVVDRAASPTAEFPRGLGVAGLRDYWQQRSAGYVAGLVIGMGGPDDAEFDLALARLREILDEAAA